MPRYIVKLTEADQEWYMEWSTIVDAPVTYGMSLEEFKEYYRDEYGRHGFIDLEDRLLRVSECGTSSRIDDSAEEVIAYNKAGKYGTILSKEQIIEYFCKRKDETNLPEGRRIDDEN